jgi:type II secretory pathway pseudopilin PulG
MSRGERGEVSLVSLLVACTLLVVVLGATLTLFEGFIAKAGDATRRTDTQDAARTAADRIARDLRNLSSPTSAQPQAVDRASGSDLIFKTVDPAGPNTGTNATNTKRVRYCLDSGRRLQEQTQTWTSEAVPAVPSGTACPAAADWTRTTIVATNVVNGTVPVFTYDAPVLTDISAIHVDLLVDTDIVRLPPATRLSTGVFLRNQNRRPAPTFVADRTAGGFVLNGSASGDPEGDTLRYEWFDGTAKVGTGITYTYTGLAAGSVHQLQLKVSDPAGLVGVSATQAVTA